MWGVAGILVVAAACRWVVHLQLLDYVLYGVPLIDAQEYLEWAARLAVGGGDVPGVFYKAPLYPYLLSLWMRATSTSVASAYGLNAVLGVVNVALLYLWTRRMASTGLAVAAACLAAVYGPFLYFEAQALPATLGVTLALGSLLATQVVPQRSSRSALYAWIAGGCLGVLILTRPSFALWAFVAWIWLWRRAPRRRQALWAVAATLLVILPVTLRNRIEGGAWVVVSANAGINFFLGNNDDAVHTSTLRPGLEWEDLVRNVPDAARSNQAQWDRYFAGRAATWLRDNPLGFLAGLGRKTLQFWNAREIHRNLDPSGFREHSSLLRAAPRSGWLLPFVLLGAVVAWRRGSAARLCVAFAASGMAATVVVFVAERYRMDVAPAFLPLAVLGVVEARAQIAGRGSLSPLVAAPLFLFPVAVTLFDLGAIGNLRQARAAVQEGVAFYATGDYPRAAAALQHAIQLFPDDADAQCQLGMAYQHLEKLDAALQAYEVAHRLVPGNPKPLANAAWILRARGELDEARKRYERAAELDPRDTLTQFQLGEVYEASQEWASAARCYEQVLALNPDHSVGMEARAALLRVRARLRHP